MMIYIIGAREPCLDVQLTFVIASLRGLPQRFIDLMARTRTRLHDLLPRCLVVFIELSVARVVIVIVTNCGLTFKQFSANIYSIQEKQMSPIAPRILISAVVWNGNLQRILYMVFHA